MQRIEWYLQKKIEQALDTLSYPKLPFAFEIPKIETHGDLSVNLAMLLVKEIRQNPRQIAQQIIDNLDLDPDQIAKTEVAGPGFINFFFAPAYLQKAVNSILDEEGDFGRQDFAAGQKAQVEFVSANPTGPLTIGHGRQAVLGDTLANFLEWAGFQVTREYYFNNAGRQMRVLGDSVKLRYEELLGKPVDFPEDYYQGEYIPVFQVFQPALILFHFLIYSPF